MVCEVFTLFISRRIGTLWWLFLGFVVTRLKSRITATTFDRINRWTGVLIAAFGFALLMGVVW